jgi:heat shock protein HslJ
MVTRNLVVGILLMLALAVLLAGCGESGAAASLDDTRWVLRSLNGGSPLAGTEVTVAFEDGEVSGSAGCNSYFGSYRVEGEDKLTLTDLANTEMACFEPQGIMEQEVEYLSVLRAATGFRLSDGELQLFSAGGGLLVFMQAG